MAITISETILTEAYPIITFFMFVLGACIGSFLNVVICRIPQRQSIIHPPSSCPKCGHKLSALENIPLISWLFLKARCRQCKTPISISYPFVELSVACLFVAIWVKTVQADLPLATLPCLLFFATALLAAGIIDARHGIIPNKITYTGLIAALAAAFILPASRNIPALTVAFPAVDSQRLKLIPEITNFLPLSNPHLTAPADVLFNILVTFLFLWIIQVVGTLARGRIKHKPDRTQKITLTKNSLYITDPSDNNFSQSDIHQLTAKLHDVSLKYYDSSNQLKSLLLSSAELQISKNKVKLDSLSFSGSEILSLKGFTESWYTPQKVLGWGDIKLMAMIVAFTGLGATLFILLTASVSGLIAGLLRNCLSSAKHKHIPFGPFLAAGSYIWIFCGPFLFDTIMQSF